MIPRVRVMLAVIVALPLWSACSPRPESGPGRWARAVPPAGGEFTTLSYNVAGLPQEVSKVNPREHLPLISPLLNAYDLVLTQEDFDWWQPGLDRLDFARYHERLREKADHRYRSARHPGPAAVGIFVATQRPLLQVGDGLGLLSRFAFKDLTRVPWKTFGPAASDGLSMKGFSMARVELAPGAEIDIYNLHADAGDGKPDAEARRSGFEQLAEWIEEHSRGHAVILGGDTNLHTGAGSADLGTWEGFLARTGMQDVRKGDDSIDKFAYRDGGGVELEPLDAAFEGAKFRDASGAPLSDHEPLAVKWRWSTREE